MASFAGMLLAAGKGTRIGALSRLRPKPLLPVGASTPFARAVDALRAAGVKTIVANASHLAQAVVEAGRTLDVEVVVEEHGPFGTAGGVAHARERLVADHVVVWNGDIVAEIRLDVLMRAQEERNAVASLAVFDVGAPGTGNVGLDAEGRIVRLRRESIAPEVHGAVFVPVHVVRRDLVERAPLRGCMVGDVHLPALRGGSTLLGVACVERWFDIGDLATYLAANVDASHVAPDVRIPREITVDRCTLREGAKIVGAGAMREVVVWPGCTARAPLSRAIVVDGDEVVPVPDAITDAITAQRTTTLSSEPPSRSP